MTVPAVPLPLIVAFQRPGRIYVYLWEETTTQEEVEEIKLDFGWSPGPPVVPCNFGVVGHIRRFPRDGGGSPIPFGGTAINEANSQFHLYSSEWVAHPIADFITAALAAGL